MPLHLQLVVTVDGGELVLTMVNGQFHSRLDIDDSMDPVESLELFEQGAVPRRFLWSHDELDEALHRNGYVRTTAWTYGPRAHITLL